MKKNEIMKSVSGTVHKVGFQLQRKSLSNCLKAGGIPWLS